MLKCAIITPGFLPVPAVDGGAIEMLVTNLIEANEKEEYFDFDIFTIESKNSLNYKYHNCNIKTIKISKFYRLFDTLMNKIFSIFNINNYTSRYIDLVCNEIKICNKKYDYILIENNMYLYKRVFESYNKDTKFIFHLHNDIGNRDKPIRLCKFISDTSYKVLTVSDFLNEKFKKVTGCNHVETYYNCINKKSFLSEISGYPSRKKLNMKQNDIIFMYTGRFSKEKGLLELIFSFENICKKHKNVKLLVVGNNDEKNSYTKKVKKISYKLKDKIIFAGYVDNDKLANYYKLCDVVIIPSICDEAFGIVALEAMLMKKPLIVSNRGGLSEIVNDDCAILVENDNFVDGLCDAIEKMIDLKDYRNDMGENGYKRFIYNNSFDFDNYFKNFIDFIK